MVTITAKKTSPFVTFTMEATHYSSDIANNRSRVRLYLRASKGTGSFFNGSGVQAGRVNGTEFGRHEATPFLPSASSGWSDGPWYVWVSHNSSGVASAALEMHLVYGTIADVHSGSLALPTIPQTPTGLSATRVSDGRVDLSWSKQGTTTGAVVQRRTDGGSWQQVGAPSGNVTSYSDTTTTGNHKYEYRVAGKATAGQSGWSSTVTVYTTPAVPGAPSAVRSGDDIVVSGSFSSVATGVDVRDGSTVVAENVSLPWTHVDPDPGEPHQYEIRAVRGALSSGWSQPSNVVQLISPPNAPVNLAPNGVVREVGEDGNLTWVHNPVDSSPQSEYEVRFRLDGGAWTTVGGGSDPESPWTWLSGLMEWQVRTKGAHPDWSPWSAVATVTGIQAPGVAILTPETEWDASTLTAVWSWFQPEGYPQSSWQLQLLDESQVIESRSGSGATDHYTLSTRLTEGDYTLRVRAATGDVWSAWAEQAFTVAFDPPAFPILSGDWSETEGVVTLTVSAGGAAGPVDLDDLVSDDRWVLWDAVPDTTDVEMVDSGAPETVRLLVERLTGDEWVTVLDGDAGTFIDAESQSYGDIIYRATSFTAEGASSVTEIIVPARSGALWLSGGPGFMITCRLPFNPQVQITAGRQRALKQFAGRSNPVAFSGEALSRVIAVSGMTRDHEMDGETTADVEALTVLAQSPEPLFQWRDPDGRVVVGVIDVIDMPRQGVTGSTTSWNGIWGYSFTLTEAEA